MLGAPLKPVIGSSAAPTMRSELCALSSVLLFTLAVLLIHGYHPFAEDAGIYLAGLRKLADPSLYQHDAPFVLANTHLSLFAHLGGLVLRIARIPLDWLLLVTHVTSIFLFLLACRTLARRIFSSPAEQWTAVLLAAALFALPVAGTTLMLMDPYVTARSFSTPLGLFALTTAIDRRYARMALILLVAALLHPLMAFYAAAFIFLFVLIDRGHIRTAWTLAAMGTLGCAAIRAAPLHAPVSPAWQQAILSRSYLFPSEWKWFEYTGLAMPLLLIALAFRRLGTRTLTGKLCLAALVLGTSTALAAFLFVHPSNPGFLARLQLLRAFHMLYLVGIILLGGLIGNLFRSRPSLRLILCSTHGSAAFAMFLTARLTYPASDHIELPGATARDPWEQAFLWIRANTLPNAVFAANPDLVLLRGEDGQSFRVITGRSLLADYKDEGVVINFPNLAPQWATEYNAQKSVDQLSDHDRLARLRPLGATWLLLSRNAVTSFPCPYRNAVSQVCQFSVFRQ